MLKQSLIIKLIGKITLENPTINQLQLRDIIGSILEDYNITTKSTSLIVSDLHDKITLLKYKCKYLGDIYYSITFK